MFNAKEVLFDFVGQKVTKVDGSNYIVELEHGARYLIDFRHNRQFFLVMSDQSIRCVNSTYYGAILIIRDKFSKKTEFADELFIAGHYVILNDRVDEEFISYFGKQGDIIRAEEFADDNKLYRHLQKRYIDKWLDEREKWNGHFEEYKENRSTISYANGQILISS